MTSATVPALAIRELHRELVQQAQQQGVSLSTLLLTYLAREAGYAAAAGGPEQRSSWVP